MFTVYEHVLHSDLPNKYFGMRHWKQEFGILGKSENINRITVTNEILEAAFIVIYQLNQAFWNQTHKLSIIFIHSYNFNIFTFITMFAIHHYSKTYTGICARKHTCTSKVSLFFFRSRSYLKYLIFMTQALLELNQWILVNVFKSKIMLCYYIVLPLTIDSDCYQWGSFWYIQAVRPVSQRSCSYNL